MSKVKPPSSFPFFPRIYVHSQGLYSFPRSIPAPSQSSAPQAFPTWGSTFPLLHIDLPQHDINLLLLISTRVTNTKHLCEDSSGSLRTFWLVPSPAQLASPKRGRQCNHSLISMWISARRELRFIFPLTAM